MTRGELREVKGDVTDPKFTKDNEVAIIPHVCNDIGKMGRGVALALKKKWPSVYYYYAHRMVMELGYISWVNVNTNKSDIIVVNMISQSGLRSPKNPKPIKYWALLKCMEEVNLFIKEKIEPYQNPVIHCPRFGSELAGGSWDFILELIKETWINNGLDVVVYDYEV
jgi:hypothetical protein